MKAGVDFNGSRYQMYFDNHSPRFWGINWRATRFFGRADFFIHGPVIITGTSEKWHCLRVYGTRGDILSKLSHLTFKDAYDVRPTSSKGERQYVVARDLSDITMMKMVL